MAPTFDDWLAGAGAVDPEPTSVSGVDIAPLVLPVLGFRASLPDPSLGTKTGRLPLLMLLSQGGYTGDTLESLPFPVGTGQGGPFPGLCL